MYYSGLWYGRCYGTSKWGPWPLSLIFYIVNMKYNNSNSIKNGLIHATLLYFLLFLVIFISKYFESLYSQKSILPSYGHESAVTMMIFLLFVYIDVFIVIKNIVFSIFYKSKYDIGWSIIHTIVILFLSFYFRLTWDFNFLFCVFS